jgi:hypothetical protein
MRTHDEILERLGDWMDGELEPAETTLLERHLAGCGACRAAAVELRELLEQAAALPREIAPGRDLWGAIEERIRDRPVIPIRIARPPVRRGWTREILAAAAAALVVVSSATTAYLMQRSPGAPLASPVPVGGGTQEGTAFVAFGPAEAEYLRVAGELEAVLEAGHGVLAPETVEVVEASLAIIDEAIREVRAALEADPNNRDLVMLLSGAYGRRVELLQTAAMIQTKS